MNNKPPNIALWLLKLLSDSNQIFSTTGDFEEIYNEIAAEKGKRKARLWFWGQVLSSIPMFLRDQVNEKSILLKSYLKSACRTLKNNKLYSSFNIAGLAVGLTCFTILYLTIDYNYNFDAFHTKAKNLHGLTFSLERGEEFRDTGIIPNPVAKKIRDSIPEIEDTFNFFQGNTSVFSYEDKMFYESRLFFVEENFFEIFDFELINGSKKEALQNPNSIIISADAAMKYFGESEPMGKTLTINSAHNLIVTGVIENYPRDSSLRYEFLVPFSFAKNFFAYTEDKYTNFVTTLLLLGNDSQKDEVEQKLFSSLQNWYDNGKYKLQNVFLVSFLDIHMYTRDIPFHLYKTDIIEMYMAYTLAFMILCIVALNFTNLSTARYVKRAKEVAMRKVIGANRKQLFIQFLGESVLQSLIAFLICPGLYKLVLPYWYDLLDKDLGLSLFSRPDLIFILLSVSLTTGILSGIYPSFFLSSFKPIAVLKDNLFSGRKRINLRKLLVTSQYAFSAILLISTFAMMNHFNAMKALNLGFSTDNVILVSIPEGNASVFTPFKNELLQHKDITMVSGSRGIPGNWYTEGSVRIQTTGGEKDYTLNLYGVQSDFVQLMNLELIAGRTFEKHGASASESISLILTERTIGLFADNNPIGQQLMVNGQEGTVVGIVKDFQFKHIRNEIKPTILYLDEKETNYFLVKYTNSFEDAVKRVRATWSTFIPDHPFSFDSLNGAIASTYVGYQRVAQLFGVLATIGIIISCIGLFAAASFSIEQRLKEIAVRKILGATFGTVVKLFYTDFLKIVFIANVIALPTGYFLMKKLLLLISSSATGLNIETLLVTFMVTVFSALVTVSYLIIRATGTQPANLLRNS